MRKFSVLLFACMCLPLLSPSLSAQTMRPRWVQKGTASLNRERTNDSYTFQALGTEEDNVTFFETGGWQPLKDYVVGKYGVDSGSVQLDSLDCNGTMTYRLRFPSVGGGVSIVYAQPVDSWSRLSDRIDSWSYERHRLYAVSEADAVPQFDTYTLTEKYGAKPVLMSIIPGLGQIYKGQKGKGYALLGTEAVFVGGIVYGELQRARYMRLGRSEGDTAGYESKAATFGQLRNVCIAAAGALYIYNLIDAGVSKGARRVVVKGAQKSEAEMSFAPVVTEYGAIGAGMSVKF